MKLETLRKLVIQSLIADDDFFDLFTLKGGNALLVHKINARASIDIDVSMENSFEDKDLDSTQQKFEKTLKDTFSRENYTVIDVKLKKKPKKMPKEKEKFWGGYTLEFKIVSLENKSKLDRSTI
jgi:divalent metal cation (Fe/Co/Zn/Cd) transporter